MLLFPTLMKALRLVGRVFFFLATCTSLLLLIFTVRLWQRSYSDDPDQRLAFVQGNEKRQYSDNLDRGIYTLSVYESHGPRARDITFRRIFSVPFWMPAIATAILPAIWILVLVRRRAMRRGKGFEVALLELSATSGAKPESPSQSRTER